MILAAAMPLLRLILAFTLASMCLLALLCVWNTHREVLILRERLDEALLEQQRRLEQTVEIFDSPAAAAPWSDHDRIHALNDLIAVSPFGYRNGSFECCPTHDKRLKVQTRHMKYKLCYERQGGSGMVRSETPPNVLEACASKKHEIDSRALTRERALSVYVNGKVVSVDDIAYGTEILFQQRHMHSMVTFLGVGMQQDPNDAIAIADLLWRVRPRLLIELGTSGGGSALFYARVMRGYDPEARVLTMDPAIDTVPLQNWNHVEMRSFCSHCQPASATRMWKAAVTFVHALPSSSKALQSAAKLADAATAAGRAVLVMEDSNHLYDSVSGNPTEPHTQCTEHRPQRIQCTVHH